MITEPELTGGSTAEPSRGSHPADAVRQTAPRAGRRGARRPWLWGALAGAVAASGVWVGPVLAGGLSPPGGPPDLHGYRIGASPCAGRAFDVLATAVGADSTSTTPASFSRGPALDRAQCTYAARTAPEHGWATGYQLLASVDLHKTTDPRAEFEDERAVDDATLIAADTVTEVRGLGDDAYLLTFDDQTRILKVLRGGAVITLRLTAATRWAGAGPGPRPGELLSETPQVPQPADLGRVSPALTRAARALMATLRTSGPHE